MDFWDFLERGGISEAWSPDGSQIAFGAYVLDAESTALYVGPRDGSVQQIGSTDVGAVSAQWSPNGEWIAFTSRFSSQPQVWIVRPDGSGLTQLTSGNDGSTSIAPIWSADGLKLAFEGKLGGGSDALDDECRRHRPEAGHPNTSGQGLCRSLRLVASASSLDKPSRASAMADCARLTLEAPPLEGRGCRPLGRDAVGRLRASACGRWARCLREINAGRVPK